MIRKPLPPGAGTRRGLTLIELLVVIGILSVLVALAVGVILPLIGTTDEKNTETLLRKLDDAIQQRWTEVRKKADSETVPSPVVQNLAGGDQARARVIWFKLRLKQHFPTSYAEALNPAAGYLPSLYKYKLQAAGVTGNEPPTLPQMSACLLLALQRSEKGYQFNAEESLGAGALQDTDGDGLPEIVDGWGTPIAFYRWACYHPDMLDTSANGEAARRDRRSPRFDPEDPEGLLLNPTWLASPQYTAFQGLCHPINLSVTPPRAYFSIPVMVSCGPNRNLGLDLQINFMQPQAGTNADDNIYSFRLR